MKQQLCSWIKMNHRYQKQKQSTRSKWHFRFLVEEFTDHVSGITQQFWGQRFSFEDDNIFVSGDPTTL